MLALFLLLIFGLGMAVFATQNTGTVHIIVGSFVLTGIPLYMLVVASILLGILVSWLISLANIISAEFTIHGKETALKRAQKVIEDLKQDNVALEKENIRLKEESRHIPHEQEEIPVQRPSFVQRFKHNFG